MRTNQPVSRPSNVRLIRCCITSPHLVRFVAKGEPAPLHANFVFFWCTKLLKDRHNPAVYHVVLVSDAGRDFEMKVSHMKSEYSQSNCKKTCMFNLQL